VRIVGTIYIQLDKDARYKQQCETSGPSTNNNCQLKQGAAEKPDDFQN
jgi:hypothetical protein